ncbi:MAG: hypothetical protein PHP10_04010 [Candidatus Omnitrophica bacterium]|nr:hypothetical protein [Candidatus Omnitrophota bacterium]
MNMASTLLWVLGILNLLGGIVLGIPQIAQGKAVAFPFYVLIIGLVACGTGYFLRKKLRQAGIAAIVVSLLSFFSPPLVGLILGISVIVLVTTKWKELS